MQVAFYKGTRKGLPGIYNRIVRFLDGSKYSHAELIFSDGLSGSSSVTDKGVRLKLIEYDLSKWDLFDLDESYSELYARTCFETQKGKKYDYMGNLRVVIPFWFHSKNKWFCTEIIAYSLRLPFMETYGPRKLYNSLKYKGK